MESAISNHMFMDALIGLQSGCLMPWDRQLLSSAPLPESVIEPFTSQEVKDVSLSMALTCDTMRMWMEEAKKANYFSKRFVKLSRMIMNAVTSMARGLITLHARGEDLGSAPMSIQDLIGVASYHFRKSYLGVLQTIKEFPEISENLLMNQINWNNMLMRLFKTREKLAKPIAGASVQGPVDSGRDLKNKDSNLLPSGEKDLNLSDGKNDVFDPFKVFGPGDRGISEPTAIREPGAFTASRAFSSYDKTSRHEAHEDGPAAAALPAQQDDKTSRHEAHEDSSAAAARPAQQDDKTSRYEAHEDGPAAAALPAQQDNKTSRYEAHEDSPAAATLPTQQDNKTSRHEAHEDSPAAAALPAQQGCSPCCAAENEDNHLPETAVSDQEPYPPDEDPPLPDVAPPPDYHEILDRASGRSTEDGKEKFVFTIDEIETLLDDPVFCAENPDLVMKILEYLSVLYEIQSGEEADEFSDL